ncbi:MAG: DUF5989 family protein [Microcystaceae cyanobacterium]
MTNLTKYNYLRRWRERKRIGRTKQLITFGMTLGLLITLFSGFQYLFVIGANDTLWWFLLTTGIVIFLLSFIIPSSISPIEKLLRLITQWIGKTIFLLMLVLIYFILVFPVGLVLRSVKGTEPFYTWEKTCELTVKGWVKKELTEDIKTFDKSSQKLPLILQPIKIISYFSRNGHYLFIPLLILMLILGLVMFFVQTSSLAPFIYTLF